MIERWTWWVVKGCVLPFFTQGKSRFFPKRFQYKGHHNAWGDSGLGLGGCSRWQVESRLRCKACKTFHLMFVRRRRSSPRLYFMWNEVRGLFSRDTALIALSEWTTLSLLHVLILMELFFSGTYWIYNYRITLQEAAVGVCSGTLHPYFSKHLAFPSWNLTRPFDFFFPLSLTAVWTG